jgi:hypothetical protein
LVDCCCHLYKAGDAVVGDIVVIRQGVKSRAWPTLIFLARGQKGMFTRNIDGFAGVGKRAPVLAISFYLFNGKFESIRREALDTTDGESWKSIDDETRTQSQKSNLKLHD